MNFTPMENKLQIHSIGQAGQAQMVIFGGFYENCQDLNRYM
jgi:hypothetical protein